VPTAHRLVRHGVVYVRATELMPPCRNYRRDRIHEWTPVMTVSGCQTGCEGYGVMALDPCPFDTDWAAAARTCPCYR
jgi:hypothetical protein